MLSYCPYKRLPNGHTVIIRYNTRGTFALAIVMWHIITAYNNRIMPVKPFGRIIHAEHHMLAISWYSPKGGGGLVFLAQLSMMCS